MKERPRIGTVGEYSVVIEQQHAIDFASNEMPAVLCTPVLVGFLERAARVALEPLLEPGENTVGVEIEVQHLAATPLGHRVTCRARVIHVDGTLVSFQLEAHDDRERIARGMHKRRLIRMDRFRQRVAGKRQPS